MNVPRTYISSKKKKKEGTSVSKLSQHPPFIPRSEKRTSLRLCVFLFSFDLLCLFVCLFFFFFFSFLFFTFFGYDLLNYIFAVLVFFFPSKKLEKGKRGEEVNKDECVTTSLKKNGGGGREE